MTSRRVGIMQALGCEVFDAYNGQQALKLLQAHPEIQVLFTDVRMPGMSGTELAETAQRLQPDLKIVLTSGYEARVGQKNKIARRWARRGTRPRAPHDQRTSSVYIFGAICPQQGKGAALVMPRCDTQAMSLHLAEVAQAVAPGAHGVMLMDRAGWHRAEDLVVPDNLTLVLLPARAPELNPVENIWHFLRENWLSSRVFASYRDIVDHCCDAWNRLVDQPWLIMSIGLRDWANA